MAGFVVDRRARALAARPGRLSSLPVTARLDRLPSSGRAETSRRLWALALVAGAAGLVFWLTALVDDRVGAGIVAMWCFVVVAAVLALVLPLTLALVAPLFVGLLGWLVDMLPLVILVGWGMVVLRWGYGVVRDRRWPRGGRWVWLPIALAAWTALSVVVVRPGDFRHFLLLVAVQVVISGVMVAAVDQLAPLDRRIAVAGGLLAFVVVLSVGVGLEWIGLPVRALQHAAVSDVAEEAYGVDAFPNNIGMIKYARSSRAGSLELTRRLRNFHAREPAAPASDVILPRFRAFENHLIVRFAGSARAWESDLRRLNIDLVYDNVGLAPANTVPRLRSFARNALTYAGISAALFPIAFFFAWSNEPRRRRLGWVAVAACLFGAGFALARGAWIAIALGVVYLIVDGAISARHKRQVIASLVIGAAIVTATFLVKYGVDPVTGRAGGGASVATRSDLYEETLDSITGIHVLLGYGTEQPRTASGTAREGVAGKKYVPQAGTHSTFLNYLFRAGVPAAIGIAAIYLLAGLHARAAARLRGGAERRFASLIAASVVTFGAHAVILSLYVEPMYTLTISLLVGLAMAGGVHLPGSILPWRTPRPSS